MPLEPNYVIFSQYGSPQDIDAVSPSSHLSLSSPQLLHANVTPISEQTSSPPGLEMILTTRPSSLPSPELLRHLYVELCVTFLAANTQCTIDRVDVFFKFHPHAGRLFHAASFMNSLSLPSTHPRFPSIPVLHAICAIGSFYTAAVTSPPLPDFTQVSPGRHSSLLALIEDYLLSQRKYLWRGCGLKSRGPIHSPSNRLNWLVSPQSVLTCLGRTFSTPSKVLELLIYFLWFAYRSCSQRHLDVVLLVTWQVSID